MHEKQKTYFGVGSVQRVRGILARHRPTHIMLITGRHSYEASGAKKELDILLQHHQVTRWNNFAVNPRKEDIQKGSAIVRSAHCDLIIAVGGGSVIDMGKLINNHLFLPLIALPTTAGTGSEATHFATFYHRKIKYSLAHPRLLPAYAVVDPLFTFNLPSYVAACTGMDALAQGIESYWSTHATAQSRRYAREAIMLAWRFLARAVTNPTPQVRIAMSKAALLAGRAINISKTTVCHAVSYPFTAFFRVPHGHAVAITLSRVLAYNAEHAPTPAAQGAIRSILTFLDARNVREAVCAIDALMDTIGLARRLRDLGMNNKNDINRVVRYVNAERLSHNPSPMDAKTIKALCEQVW